MGDWFRSVTVLAVAFVGAVVVTIGLANVIVPGGAAGPQSAAGDAGGAATGTPTASPIMGIGGNLTVSGDREGTLTVTRESNEGRYSLVGDGARVVFEGSRPPVVSQVSWDGLDFFPEPDACTVIPGELDDEIGVGYVEVRCEDLEDIRGGETVSMAGTLGLALTTVGESDLPQMGGSVTVGEETWEFDEAFLFQFPVNQGAGTEDYNMVLTDPGRGVLRFRYDVQTHRLTLVNVERGGEASELNASACSLGTVAIRGTPIVQQIEFAP
jgi:hypothetical protein